MSERPDRWLNVGVRHLTALSTIAHEGSFREAAESLGYVQSAVSQQLAQLERLLGTRLVERSRGTGPVTLTEAGALLLEHVDEILARYERAQEDLLTLSDGLGGRLRVGMLPWVATAVLPRVLPSYAQRCPEVEVLPAEDADDTLLLAALLAGELDLAICELPLTEGPLACEELLEQPPALLVAVGSPLALRATPVTAADLDDLPLVAHEHWRGERAVLDWLAARGSVPRVVFCSEHGATVRSLVAAGMGAALAPGPAAERVDADTVALPIEQAPAQTIAIAWHAQRPQSAAADAFRAVVRDVSRP